MDSTIITLIHQGQQVNIEAGELVGYQQDGHEFIHQKGSPGWRSADTEMFPIIGPTNEAGFQVQVPRGSALLDQHGHLREMEYDCTEQSQNHAFFRKVYQAGSPIRNSKFPEKSTRQWLVWPYSFTFWKKFYLEESQLRVEFEVEGETDMPFMLGYHPAFKLYSSEAHLLIGERRIELSEVLAVGSRALEVPRSNKILLVDQRMLEISSQGFEHFMLWTEVPNMICVEPISFYPYALEQRNLHEGFQYLQGIQKYQVCIKPV